MFYLLLSLLHEDFISQRIDRDTYNSSVFLLASDYEKLGEITTL